MLNGFGLEKLGIAALRFPKAATLAVVLVTLAGLVGLTRLEFSGENIEILRDGSQELADYDALLANFRDFNNDAVILMRVENLASVEGIETFRELNFEFQLDERVESILSIFSLVKYGGPEQGWQSALPAEFQSDEQVRTELMQLAKDIPSSQSLFSKNFDSAVMVVYTKASAIGDANVQETMRGLTELGREFETDTVSVSIAGQPAIRSDLINSIASDIVYLAPFAIVLCAALAFFLFRHPAAMLLCAMPSVLALIWFLGAAGLSGTSLNFLTNILPVLIVVIVFADTLHLYLKWQSNIAGNMAAHAAIKASLREIGPASAVSSLTTAAALLSLCFSGNHGLFELGIIGAMAVLGGFVAIITGFTVTAYWLARAGFLPRKSVANRLSMAAHPAMRILPRRKTVISIGLVLAGLGLYAHFNIDSRFRLIDYLGTASEVGQSEDYIDQTYSGTTPLFAVIDMDRSRRLDDPLNEARVYDTISAVTDVFPAGTFYSLADFADEIKKAGGQISEELIDELPRFLTSRFISEDKKQVLVTIFASANFSANEMQVRLNQLQDALEKRNLDAFVKITGYPVLSGVVAPRLMDNLRVSLLIAVILSILIIAASARSIRYGLACLVPNLMPIVMVELILFALNVPLNLSITVALTVAFGIAVDDSVHMLNQYLINRKHHENALAVRGALKEVTPAIFSTTLILSGGLVVMSFSTLPAMAVFSAVMIMTLVFAFLADIFQLPAYLAVLD